MDQTAPHDLFAALARRALVPRAIAPRLPSRFEALSALAGDVEPPAMAMAMAMEEPGTAAASAAGAHHPMAARIGHLPVPALRAAPAPNDASPATPPPSSAVFRVEHTAPLAVATTLAAPTASMPGERAAVDATRVELRAALRAAQAAVAQLKTLQAATADPRPARYEPPSGPALQPAPVPPMASPAPAPYSSAAAGVLEALRSRHIERLDAPQHTPEAGSAPAVMSPPHSARSAAAAPHVDITIGSIDIVVAPAFAPAPAPRSSAAAQTPAAVQSLNDYLQSRQRKGGPR